ncbi:MAG: OprO/OprP family phosphate-selective porin [Bacteroidaceae bacterium]|nr:OprO/OprP family phosphate-selective porin [Bacteroidaceae bacterium]
MKTIPTICAMMLCLSSHAETLNDTEQHAVAETPASESVCNDEAFLNSNYWTLQQSVMPAQKEWKRDAAVTAPNFGGYFVGSYKYDDSNHATHGDGFGIRYVRLYLDGIVFKDFKYRIQLEVNGSPHIKDATLEWIHYKGFQVKVGQFKRAFSYENPYNPWNVGTGDYSQLTKKLAGMGDRCGEASTGGRDLGVQLQGDLFKAKSDGHYQFHYQAAVYNGQGINNKDLNNSKDFMGTIQWSPIKNLSLGAFGWSGSWYSSDKKINVDRKRYAFGVKYEDDKSGWSARAEYARSKGHKASDWDSANGTWTAKSLSQNGGDKADAWYVTVGVPVWRWIKCYAKYDAYRDYATNSSLHNIYSISCNLQPHNNLMLQLQYNYHDDKTATAPERHYNQLWAQAYVRF